MEKERWRQLRLPLRIPKQKPDHERDPLNYLRSLVGKNSVATFSRENLSVGVFRDLDMNADPPLAHVDIWRDGHFLEGYIITSSEVDYSGTNWPTLTGFKASPNLVPLHPLDQAYLYYAQATAIARFVANFKNQS